MSDWPVNRLVPNITIHPWSLESLANIINSVSPTVALAASSQSTWPSANRAIYVPFTLYDNFVLKALWVSNGSTVTGNIDIGVYDVAGTRLTSIGSTAQSGTSTVQIVSVTALTLAPGRYYMALVMSSTSCTLKRVAGGNILKAARAAEQASALALPATATFSAISTMTDIPVFGLASRSDL